MFRPMTSNVSALSGIVAKGHQAIQHVSSSPSKIPYVGFSPVRLQTGIGPRSSHTQEGLSARPAFTHPGQTYTWSKLSSRKKDFPQLYSRFFRNGDKAQPDLPSISMSSNPVQRPLARQRVMLSLRVNAYYGLIRNSQSLPSFYELYDEPLSYGLVWTGIERLPNLLRESFPSVPPNVPRRTERLHLTVTSSLVLAFALFAQARHPQFHHVGSKVDRVTRLQSSLNATARADRLPYTDKGFYFRAFALMGHPRGASDITMRVNRQFPQPTYTGWTRGPMGCERRTRRRGAQRGEAARRARTIKLRNTDIIYQIILRT